jgi:hypothetical protein
VAFGLGAGPDRSGTAGAWNSNNNTSATGAVSVIGTLDATFYLTGVQLEAGDTATPFEHRSFGQELALCQRYFRKISSGNTGVGGIIGVGSQVNTTAAYFYVAVSPQMRAAPTLAFSSLIVSDSVAFDEAATVGGITATQDSVYVDVSFPAAGTQYRPVNLRATGNSSGHLTMSSEL